MNRKCLTQPIIIINTNYHAGKRKENSHQKHQFVDYIMDLLLVT